MSMADLTWTCHVCNRERSDAQISVVTTDMSAERGLPEGTIKQNVKYCNDDADCTEKAKTHRLIPKPKENKDE